MSSQMVRIRLHQTITKCRDLGDQEETPVMKRTLAASDGKDAELNFARDARELQPEQRTIEKTAHHIKTPKIHLLHVGIGNSSPAKRWHLKMCTVNEIRHLKYDLTTTKSLQASSRLATLVYQRLNVLPVRCNRATIYSEGNSLITRFRRFTFFLMWPRHSNPPEGDEATEIDQLCSIPLNPDPGRSRNDNNVRRTVQRFGLNLDFSALHPTTPAMKGSTQ
jgi:hypothetical protein